jgi:hypothetical protein
MEVVFHINDCRKLRITRLGLHPSGVMFLLNFVKNRSAGSTFERAAQPQIALKFHKPTPFRNGKGSEI